MYDQTTADLIRSIPTVRGFDSERMPELLTACYAQISSSRLLLADGESDADLNEALRELQALAQALQIHAALTTEPRLRESAAFVSASAHQLLFKADRLRGKNTTGRVELNASSVPAEIASALLFLAAGYPADSAESASAIQGFSTDGDPRNEVLRAVIALCKGNLRAVGGARIGRSPEVPTEEQAELLLWDKLLRAIQLLARRMLEPSGASIATYNEFVAQCEEVISLSIAEIDLPRELQMSRPVYAGYAAPHHLATLLLGAGNGLNGRALTDVPDPLGPDSVDWRNFLDQRLSERPYMWTNHMDAIDAGLLNRGVSAAISFPTGAGKSTLSELKIIATVLAGSKVIYLAPTLALVGQVSRSLKNLLTEAEVDEDEVEDQLFNMPDGVLEKMVSVMTPERCLLQLTLQPEAFQDIGLIVFDECHSLHLAKESHQQRPISAMIGLLSMLELAPDADILMMSAMMANGDSVADWLRSTFGKNCLVFNACWKPTRQARGSLVFRQEEVAAARNLIPMPKGVIPQRKLNASPHAVIGLQQTWATDVLGDYGIFSLLNGKVALHGGRYFQNILDPDSAFPTVNLKSSEAAISIACEAQAKGLKVIVFFHTPSSVPKAVRLSATLADHELELSAEEQVLYEAASEELGGNDFVFVPNAVSGGHYGDLLKEERDLVEEAFKREGGPRILFSTNTLAQGMNLPADVVLIVRTKMYDQETESIQNVEVHDLLNAAGRAGRAGMSANGLVLVVPDRIVEINHDGQISRGDLRRLKDELLSQDDRCLTIIDPIESVLDRIAIEGTESSATRYLLLRLPPRNGAEDSAARTRKFIAKSFASFMAEREGRAELFTAQVSSAIDGRRDLLGADADSRLEAICAATGLDPQIVRHVLAKVAQFDEEFSGFSVRGWFQWALEMLEAVASFRGEVLRSTIRSNGTVVERNVLSESFTQWITGRSLKEIELVLGTPPDALGFLSRARKFGRETTRELSYFLGLVAQIVLTSELPRKDDVAWSASVAATLVRAGFDSREKWALQQLKRDTLRSRVRTHAESQKWLRYIEAPPQGQESSRQLLSRVGVAIREAEARLQ